MGFVGCYTLDVYCDNPEHCHPSDGNYFDEPDCFTGRTRTECLRIARQAGWTIDTRKETDSPTSGFCLCPRHSRKPNRRTAAKGGDA